MPLTLYTVPCPVEASQRIPKDWQDGQNCRREERGVSAYLLPRPVAGSPEADPYGAWKASFISSSYELIVAGSSDGWAQAGVHFCSSHASP